MTVPQDGGVVYGKIGDGEPVATTLTIGTSGAARPVTQTGVSRTLRILPQGLMVPRKIGGASKGVLYDMRGRMQSLKVEDGAAQVRAAAAWYGVR